MQSFVYEWINKDNDMRYIGKHNGNISDEYIASGKYFLKEYKLNPSNFYRNILWQGKESEVFDIELYFIKTRVQELGIEKLYNVIGTKSNIDYDFYVKHNMINFVKCLHCDQVCIKTGNNQHEVDMFERKHYDNCKYKKKIKPKKVVDHDLYKHCKRLHKSIENTKDKTKYIVNRKKEILKEYCLLSDYEYPY